MWVLTCEHAVCNWLLFRIGRCLLFWSSCSGWPGYKVECKGDFGGQVVHWRCQHCQLCLAGGPTSWKNPLLNYCILTFCRWWVCLSWTPPCQKEQETKTGKTVVRIWILPSQTQGPFEIHIVLKSKDIYYAFFGNVVRGKNELFRLVVRNGFTHFVRKVFARRKLLPGKFWVFAPLHQSTA